MDTRLPGIAVAATLCCTSATAQAVVLDRIVAVVENEAITERELAKGVMGARAMLSRQNREAPDERVLAGQVLQQIIIQQLQLQEAERIGVSVDDVTLDRAVESEAQRRGLTLEQLKQARESRNEGFREFRRGLR